MTRAPAGAGLLLVGCLGGGGAGAEEGTASSGDEGTCDAACRTTTGATATPTGGGTADSTTATNPSTSNGPSATTGGSDTLSVDSSGTSTAGRDMGAGCPEPDLLHAIWIANSYQGTVSKIDTETMVEQGRYIVRPDQNGNPSRISVSLSGDAAVANREGGVTKIYADPDACQDTNGEPGVQTSTGGGDILAWGVEECIAWYAPFEYATQRPVAWTTGTFEERTCAYEDVKLWTAGSNGPGDADVLLLDGETGVVEDSVLIPDVVGWAGLYGGAVDPDGDFWTVDHNWEGPSTLIEVDRETMAVQTWPVESDVHYGLAIDVEGRPWLCGGGGASRFDPALETWAHLPSNAPSPLGGCMTDGQGTLWHGRYPDGWLVAIDTDTLAILDEILLPEYVHGIGVDFAGHVWGVAFVGDAAYRVDPATGNVDTFEGLVGAYTYSDMTGFALASLTSG